MRDVKASTYDDCRYGDGPQCERAQSKSLLLNELDELHKAIQEAQAAFVEMEEQLRSVLSPGACLKETAKDDKPRRVCSAAVDRIEEIKYRVNEFTAHIRDQSSRLDT